MFDVLDASYQRRDIYMPNLWFLEAFDPYRDDPRFRDLMARMNR
jgi:hypothetical protein